MKSGMNGFGISVLTKVGSDVYLASGSRLVLPVSSSPQIVESANLTTGWRHEGTFLYEYCAGNPIRWTGPAGQQVTSGTYIRAYGGIDLQDYANFQPTATQSITGVGSTISADGPWIKFSSDGIYVLSNAISGGTTNGYVMIVENAGANQVTLQEGPVIPAGSAVLMGYSSDASAWIQIQL